MATRADPTTYYFGADFGEIRTKNICLKSDKLAFAVEMICELSKSKFKRNEKLNSEREGEIFSTLKVI